ncbi:putative disease resistance protein RGA3 [Forsythia ovata]|uniref:Disease resistance protein RGA3 n=1 Tax=Forsythia ovata TaxID=205694 RepID=A0ABD1QMV4_9LAMI
MDKLASSFIEKFRDLYNFKDNIRKLQQTLPMVQAILEDAQNQQETRKAVKRWLLNLEDIAYASEDLLDEMADEISKCERRSSRGKDVSGLFLPFNSDHLFDIASELQNKLKELNEIAKQGFTFNLRVEKCSGSFGRSKETWSSVVESKIYGRETLNLSGCCYLLELPFGMANVTSLRHLNIMGCEGLTQMPAGIGKLVHLQTLPIYIVGKRTWESIAELHSLNLRGELHIKCMENIRDAKEAKKANMREKKHLQMLRLQWGNSKKSKDLTPTKMASSDSSSSSLPEESIKDVEDILECLEPHANLKNLHIEGYPGIVFPRWDLPNLVTIELINCRNCISLPKLGQLPFLERLYLQGMDGITTIDVGFYGGVFPEPFPSVKFLTIKDFPNLEEWSSIDGGVPFGRLEKFILDKCPNLTDAPAFPSIQHLELHYCNAKIMESLENITSLSSLVIDMLPDLNQISGSFLGNNNCLESLEIRACQNLHLLPPEIENLIALKSLIISCCKKLSDLPPGMQKLKRLEFLEINGCHSLILLPHKEIEGLSSLKTFSIENCSNLISLSSGFHHLTALEQLSIMSCPKLTSLPDGFKNLSTLHSLNIISCPELSFLPTSLQHVMTLQSLVIHSCPYLTTLPEWFSKLSSFRSLAISNCKRFITLPDAIQTLATLQHLSIQDCPHFERLCKNMKGKEWQKIKHIPHMYIGSLKFHKGILCSND